MTTRQLLLTMAIADHVNATGRNIKWDHFVWQIRLPLKDKRNTVYTRP